MLWFKSKKEEKKLPEVELNSAEYRKLAVRLSQVEADILGLATAQDVIRNKVMKKIRIKEKESEENTEDGSVWAGIPVS